MANKSADIVWVDADGIVHVRNSERGTLDRCPQQWWWSWREGLRAKETAKPLWFGTGIHEALAHYYQPGKKRSKDYIDVWRQSIKEESDYIRINVGDPDEEEWVDAEKLGESMLTEYVKHYGGDKHWDVIATEQEFEVKIPWPAMQKYQNTEGTQLRNKIIAQITNKYGPYFILNGTFDGVYRDTTDRKIKLMEHKTAASISVGHLPMDNQAGTYWMVAGTVGHHQGWLAKRENISEITYNFLRKAMPDDRPRDAQGYATNKPLKAHYVAALTPHIDEPKHLDKMTLADMEALAAEWDVPVVGERSKRQPPPLFDRHPVRKRPMQRKQQLSRIQDEVVRMTMMVDGILTVTKAPSRDCSFCPFKDMCELHEADSDWMEYKRAMYRSTDPYADHRKSA